MLRISLSSHASPIESGMRTNQHSRITKGLLASLVLASAMVHTPVPALAQSQADIKKIESKIDDKKAEIKQIDSKASATKEDLASIQSDLQKAQNELNERTAELELAQADLDNKERLLVATAAELVKVEATVAQSKEELEKQSGIVNNRLRLSYINVQQTQMPVFQAKDAQEFATANHYLQSLLANDRAAIEHMEVLRVQITADEARLVELKTMQEQQKQAAQSERDRVNALVAQQKELVAKVQTKVNEKNRILRHLANDKASAQAVVKELEAESNKIAAQLRAIAKKQAEAKAAAAAARARGQKPSPAVSAAIVTPSKGGMIWPVRGRLSSPYGYRTHPISHVRKLHTGQDIAVGAGTPIKAAKAGRVVTAGWYGGYGLCVVIDHGGGIATLYAHQSRLGVSRGQSVSQGQVIGYVGSTGYSTGPHLHFEVRRNGSPVNPLGYL